MRAEPMLATRKHEKIADLVDFYRRWPEIRPLAKALRDRPDIGEDEHELLEWMIRVVDRVGPSDLT
jgi:hypothetical protein